MKNKPLLHLLGLCAALLSTMSDGHAQGQVIFANSSAGASAFQASPPPLAPAAPVDDFAARAEKKTAPEKDKWAGVSVNLWSGQVCVESEPLRIPGLGDKDLFWACKYTSGSGQVTAQGNGWDFVWNVRVEQGNGQKIELFDGTGRRDTYKEKQGIYTSAQFFTEGQFAPDGKFTLRFAHGGKWEFHPLNGGPETGKLKEVTNRNGSKTTLTYNPQGQLITITGPLGRSLTITYDAQGLINCVTDFDGRSVCYTYYGTNEPGGSLWDLKTETSPSVTGTPNGNDFLGGKTTTYTYTTGFNDDKRNHLLLTITDAGGQPWLRNMWAPTSQKNELLFNHVVQQTIGVSNQTTYFSYEETNPKANNNFAVLKAIVNDPVGNVMEKFYNEANQLVIEREYTGRAVPGIPTTSIQNRPATRLRATDPASFETQYEWNESARLTGLFLPDGNKTVCVFAKDKDKKVSQLAAGNLLTRRFRPGPLGGDQPVIEEKFAYETNFHFVNKFTDGNGNTTLYSYDTNGNCTQVRGPLPGVVHNFEYNTFGQVTAYMWPSNASGYLQQDTWEYYSISNGPQAGYLKNCIIDANGLALTTTFEHNAVGNVIHETCPNGGDKFYAVNQLNQIVGEMSRALNTSNGVVRYQRNTFYNANNNVVLQEVQNFDGQGVLQSNATFTTAFTYNILDQLSTVTRNVNSSNIVTTAYEYDKNGNCTLVSFPLATAGFDAFNKEKREYDERDKTFKITEAPGSPQQSTVQIDYNLNGQVSRTASGLEATPHITSYSYDGYNRPVSATDAMGNVTTWHYDANGNIISQRVDGELTDVAGSTGNVLLAAASYTYDAINRMTRTDAAFFDPATQSPIGDGQSTTEYFYSADSRLLQTRDDNGNSTFTTYDTAGRASVETDARGNTTTYGYDANGNVTSVTEVDISDLGSPDQTFITTHAYDNLDRLIQSADNAGHTTQYAYDSRGNLTFETDALNRGTRYEYDGLDRHLRTVRDMNGNGPNAAEAADIVTAQTWDNSSRLTSQGDDNGHATTYAYDALDRRTSTIFADGTTETATFDVHDNVVSSTDANGSLTTAAYDLDDRTVARTIARAAGVLGTTVEQYQYNGLSRVVAAQDDDSLVLRTYNSLSLVTRETQQPLPGGPVSVVQSAYDGVGNQTSLAYPGGRVVVQAFDPLDRLALLRNDPPGPASTIATYQYFGPRVQRRDSGNGTRSTPGYDNERRVARTTHSVIAGGTLLEDRQYSRDAVHNKTGANDLLAPENHLYTYDPADRMVASQVLPAGPAINYTLDGVGNRQSVVGGPQAGAYLMNPATPVPADFQVNQYTATPFDARVYDANGNLTGSGALELAYDYRNQLVKFTDLNTSQIFLYEYDCLGRRIAKNVAGAVTRFAYDERREIEERDAAGATLATAVWGNGIDELLELTRGGQRYFAHSDDLGSVLKMTDAGGNVAELYRFGDYGEPFFFDGAGTALSQSFINSPHLFTGRRFDPETGLYYYRSRHLDPFTGRFITRDTIGIWGDPSSLGNGYAYAGNNPASNTDPEGETNDPIPGIDVVVKKKPNGHKFSIFGGGGSVGSDGNWTIGTTRSNIKHQSFAVESESGSSGYAMKKKGPGRTEELRTNINTTRSNIKSNNFGVESGSDDGWPPVSVDRNGLPGGSRGVAMQKAKIGDKEFLVTAEKIKGFAIKAGTEDGASYTTKGPRGGVSDTHTGNRVVGYVNKGSGGK